MHRRRTRDQIDPAGLIGPGGLNAMDLEPVRSTGQNFRAARRIWTSCYEGTCMETVEAEGSGAISSSAFCEFYDQAARQVFGYLARSVMGNRSVAEDLTQETFTAVVVAAQAGRPEAYSMPWVMGAPRHKLIDYYRRIATDDRHSRA